MGSLRDAYFVSAREGPRFRPLDEPEAQDLAARDPTRCRVFLDCGTWEGDDADAPAQRTFAVLAGRTVALCEFRNGDTLRDLEGPAHEVAPANRLLRALAGPQRLDVQVLRTVRSPVPVALADDARVYVFLPHMHLALRPQMPALDTNLVPDPTQANCVCHGPLMERILYGKTGATEYAAFGCTISRDPNEWFAMMADRHRPVADDLIKLLARLTKHRTGAPVTLVQLGALFEIWAGFALHFAASGKAGVVEPRIPRGVDLDAYQRVWREQVIDSPARDAVDRYLRFPAADRITLPSELEATDATRAPERWAHDAPGSFYAESHPPPFPTRHDVSPAGVFALLEQRARFYPWIRRMADDTRTALLAGSVGAFLDRPVETQPPVYAMSQTHIPCLTRVFY